MEIKYNVERLFLGVLMTSLFACTQSDRTRVCPGDTLKIQCSTAEVIMVSSARFGRMEFTECTVVEDFIGCENDVLFLLDKWCSGHPNCHVAVPNKEFKQASTACLPYLSMYLEVDYTCLKVIDSSNLDCQKPLIVTDNEGMISSHVTATTGCGSEQSPWIISGSPGQTIELHIIDFGSEMLKIANTSSDLPVYGVIRDGSQSFTIHGHTKRERLIYKSKTNEISIEVSYQDKAASFVLQYKKTGCPDLSPPAHAWYKRDGDQAVIGCKWSQKTWHLSCDGRSWSGVVGNCSEIVTQRPVHVKNEKDKLPAALWLVCVMSVSVVLMVIAAVTGIVCIKKYKIKKGIEKSMAFRKPPGQGHYDLDPNIEMASMLYLPYKLPEQQQKQQQHDEEQQQQGTLSDPHRPTSYLIPQDQVVTELTPIRIWERPLPELPDKPCETLPTNHNRTPGDGDEAVSSHKAKEDNALTSPRM